MEKRTFLMYGEWQPLLEGMSDEQAGQLFKKIYAYQTGKEYEIQDALILGVFNRIKAKFDADRKLYDEKCEKNRANGAKGGRPKKQEKPKETERKPKETERLEEKPKAKKEEPKKNEYGEYHNVKLTEQEHAKLSEKFGEGKTAEAIKILDTYIESLAPAKKKEYLKKNHNLCMQNWVYGEVDKRKGQAKPVQRNNSFNNFQQRGYDFTALEKRLVENY
jgi:hypothetical protein